MSTHKARQLPNGGVPVYSHTLDNDRIIDSVKYPTSSGEEKTVKFVWTIDGDRVPETGHTIDGDFYYPGEKWD